MAHHQLAFGAHRVALLQGIALAADGMALDAFGRASPITLGGRHQALVEHHHGLAVGANGFGHVCGGF